MVNISYRPISLKNFVNESRTLLMKALNPFYLTGMREYLRDDLKS